MLDLRSDSHHKVRLFQGRLPVFVEDHEVPSKASGGI
jgi:hypothetical protein